VAEDRSERVKSVTFQDQHEVSDKEGDNEAHSAAANGTSSASGVPTGAIAGSGDLLASATASTPSLRWFSCVALKPSSDGTSVNWIPTMISIMATADDANAYASEFKPGADLTWMLPCIAQQDIKAIGSGGAEDSASMEPSLSALVPATKAPSELARSAGFCMEAATMYGFEQGRIALSELGVAAPDRLDSFLCLSEREVAGGSIMGEAQEVWWAFASSETMMEAVHSLRQAGIMVGTSNRYESAAADPHVGSSSIAAAVPGVAASGAGGMDAAPEDYASPSGYFTFDDINPIAGWLHKTDKS